MESMNISTMNDRKQDGEKHYDQILEKSGCIKKHGCIAWGLERFSKHTRRLPVESGFITDPAVGQAADRCANIMSALRAFPLLLAFFLTGCSGSGEQEPSRTVAETRVHGTISINGEVNDTLGHSGTEVYILDFTGSPDTLYRAYTDFDGVIDGTALFPGQGAYTLHLHRNQRRVDDTTLILAHRDTVQIEGVLPRFAGHARILSTENEAMRTLTRVERQYNRVIRIAAAGGIAQDTIPRVLDNWSSIFWEIFETWPETVAARIAARESMRMLEERNDELLMQRLREYGDHEDIRMLAARFGFMSVLNRKGLDAAMAWIDSLESESRSRDTRLRIAKNRIEVLYDSSRIDDARMRIRDYEDDFGGDEDAEAWLEVIRYDVEQLSPGMALPPFDLEFLEDAGDETVVIRLGLQDLQGAPAMIEVVSLADRMYQESYPRLQTLHMIFHGEDVQFVTIPVEQSRIALEAFYDERGQNWPVARAGAYAGSNLEEQWNVYEMPVRFLIDSRGQIIRKFHGHNVNQLLIELNNIINNGEIS